MNEKLRILKMIEDGKISAAEAAEILASLDGGGTPPSTPEPFRAHSAEPPRRDRDEQQRGRSLYDSSYSDLGEKFESFARDAAPKVEKFTKAVAEKIVGATDKLSETFAPEDGHDPQRAPSAESKKASAKSSKNEVEKQIEILVTPDVSNELNISCHNGNIHIRGYNGDKITARLTYRANKADAPIEIKKLGGKYSLHYEAEDFHSVSIDAFVPERAFGVIKIDGMNGNLDASTLSANEIRFSNANGNSSISEISAVKFFAEASNGRLTVSKIAAESATIENMNGSTEADETDVANLKLSNYNAPLSIIVSKFSRHADYIWSVETGNAKLGINLPSSHDVGYYVKAHAPMGEIRVGLANLKYVINEPSVVEAQSANLDRAAKKIKLTAETSNASLFIN
ncbi:MAG: DUF4097 domain-containing protein [Defluviitaleaceae bacterium]|nr:DUF4097 domain-containing protein [Defluviitaleaceae bacterium]